MLSARDLKLNFGDRAILNGVSLSLLPKKRVALVGHNGAGKSSLMSILAGDIEAEGILEKATGSTIGFLKQQPLLKADSSVIEVMRESLKVQLSRIEEHQALCQQVANNPDEKLITKMDNLAHAIEQHGGFDIDFLMEKVLTRLGVKAREQKVSTLSGGEKRRVDLARILLLSPDIYLLDEPTNHLDMDAIKFLVETFKKSNAAILFISHDSAFIDDLATDIFELHQGALYTHKPPFANYVENKLIRDLIDERTLHRRERLMVGELAWLRAGTPARTTKQNARIDRAYALMDQIATDEKLLHQKKLDIEAGANTRLGNTILELNQVGFAYGNRVLFKDFSLKVVAKQRFGILGRNGAGKTTLMSIIAQKLMPTFGSVIMGKNTQILQFDQHREVLDQNATLKETLANHGDYVRIDEKNIHIATYLEKYLFAPGDGNRRVNTLSGGEQNRLMLAKLMRQNANCLMLDEPTNDLDMASLAALEEVLLDYPGVIFTVSHDRRFLNRVCNMIIAFEKGTDAESKLEVYPGNYDSYLSLREKNEPQVAETKPETKKTERVKTKKKRSFKEEQELKDIPLLLEKLEQEQVKLHEELANPETFKSLDPKLMQEKVARAESIGSEIEKLYERWQELSDIG